MLLQVNKLDSQDGVTMLHDGDAWEDLNKIDFEEDPRDIKFYCRGPLEKSGYTVRLKLVKI